MDDASAFADGKWELECQKIILRPSDGSDFQVFGPGEIKLDSSGRIHFRVHLSDALPALREKLKIDLPVGSLLRPQDFFAVEAIDYTGISWFAERVMPMIPNFLQPGPQGVVTGTIDELVRFRALDGSASRDSIVFFTAGKINFPRNIVSETKVQVGGRSASSSSSLDAGGTNFGGIGVELSNGTNATMVSATFPTGRVSELVWRNIVETLQFILASRVNVSSVNWVSGSTEKFTLRTTKRDGLKSKLYPPLRFNLPPESAAAWSLFEKYFTFVLQNGEIGKWHEISCNVVSIVDGAAVTLDAECLALSVAVEVVVGICFPELGTPSTTFVAEISAVTDAVQQLPALSDKTRLRLEGTLKSLLQPRAGDRIRSFLEQNKKDPLLLSAWSKLRNSSAHGGPRSSISSEDRVRLRDQTLYLFYSVILARIGYGGPRNDYSTAGHPSRV